MSSGETLARVKTFVMQNGEEKQAKGGGGLAISKYFYYKD